MNTLQITQIDFVEETKVVILWQLLNGEEKVDSGVWERNVPTMTQDEILEYAKTKFDPKEVPNMEFSIITGKIG